MGPPRCCVRAEGLNSAPVPTVSLKNYFFVYQTVGLLARQRRALTAFLRTLKAVLDALKAVSDTAQGCVAIISVSLADDPRRSA